ncbi:hypothetical protein B296_00005230 [Ensete ventricosum]|uniref:Uncharacterized protein n=1 Tax=Ensete ventricosum TaxID=4639 RepID=A0A427AHM6_ENSVE|nr:hypothetical protein B296_00005230 [Ensete ventricosum]
MGLSFSLLSWNWVGVMRSKVFGLAEAKAAVARSISFGEKDANRLLRSLSFRRSDSSNKMAAGAGTAAGEGGHDAVMERSLSFKNWEPEPTKLDAAAASVGDQATGHDDVTLQPSCLKIPANFPAPHLKLPHQLPEFSSPRPLSELDAAATTVQKIYKSYRTRRNLADCAVVVEELWFVVVSDSLTPWIPTPIDPRHRYGHNLHLYYDVWFGSESSQPFFYWYVVHLFVEPALLIFFCLSHPPPLVECQAEEQRHFPALELSRWGSYNSSWKDGCQRRNSQDKTPQASNTKPFFFASQKCSVDDDEFPVLDEVKAKPAVADEAEVVMGEKAAEAQGERKTVALEMGRRLSCRWTTGTGARIGCVRDYPVDLQSMALEQVNLSPRVAPSPAGVKLPIPSPRPSPKVRLSPRLQYMGVPTPIVSLTLPKSKR